MVGAQSHRLRGRTGAGRFRHRPGTSSGWAKGSLTDSLGQGAENLSVLGPVDYFLWIASAFLQAAVVVCSFRGRALVKYFTLSLYMCAAFLLTVGRYFVFARYGYTSIQYFYFYYLSDAILTICLYFALMGLYSHVFQEMKVSKYLRVAALLLLAATAWFSYQVVLASSHKLLTRFVVELSQNLYFVGVVLTYLLWGAMMKLRDTRTRLIQLVLALGVYFSAFAASYALRNLYPELVIWRYVSHLMSLWLPLAWAYTFQKVPEEARLATSRVAATQR